MPSPVARSGRGLTALTFDRAFPTPARREVRRLFSQVGRSLQHSREQVRRLHRDLLFRPWLPCTGRARGRAAEKLGLDRKTALTAAAHALADGILTWRESNISVNALLHEAATPGGISRRDSGEHG